MLTINYLYCIFIYNYLYNYLYFIIRIASRKPVLKENLDVMVTESMKDINFEEEVSDGEDDPELLV